MKSGVDALFKKSSSWIDLSMLEKKTKSKKILFANFAVKVFGWPKTQ